MQYYDTIIVGGGAAAYAAAVYAGRYNLKTLIVEKEFGGETALAGKIENYPGFKAVDGFELMNAMKGQATSLGVEVIDGDVELLKNEYHCFQVKVGETVYQGKTIIIATGMEHRKLGLPREDELKGKGIHYCVTCDGPLFKGKRVGIVGGGDSAVKGANQLSDMGAEHVYLIAREDNVNRAEPINRDRLKQKKNVAVLYTTEVKGLIGEKFLESVRISKPFQGKNTIELQGLFVAIGAIPRGELPKQLGVKFDERNQIDVDPRTMKTNIDGVFAAGDITNASGSFKQIVTGAAQGSLAATSAYLDVQEHPNVCELHAVPVMGLLKEGKRSEVSDLPAGRQGRGKMGKKGKKK